MDNINWDEIRKAVKEIEDSKRVELENKPENNNSSVNNLDSDSEYALRHRLLAYATHLASVRTKTPEVRKMQENMLKSYSLIYENKVLKIIQKDLDEMERCFQVQAYKSTIIIAGSVLEAFLLDWLSEKDSKNYFKKNYYIPELKAYIDNIPELKSSETLYENTHEIRRMRNLVHPSRYFKVQNAFNEETSRRIMTYLNDVIEVRNAKIRENM